jgi:tRNA dimethylallyltransferase
LIFVFMESNTKQKYLLVVAGPTAVGKTSLALHLALHFKTEIVSADSRQFYREMNIGTAKPSEAELALVKHHFVNNLSIEQDYTAGAYEQEALTLLEILFQKCDVIVLAGGSGLFVKALCEGLDDIPEVQPTIRLQLNAEFEKGGLESLLKELKEKDPIYYERVDRANPVRVIRALELCRGTGMPFSSFRTFSKKERSFQTIKIALNRDREELYQRIDNRMEAMLANGLVEEAIALYPFRHRNALQTVGYSEVFGYLDGQYNYEEMVDLLKRNSRRYAKRQLTWFGKDKEYKWFEPEQEKEILEFIEGKILDI